MDAPVWQGFLGQRPDGSLRLTFVECSAEVLVEGLRAWGGREDRISARRIGDWRSVWDAFPTHATFELVCEATATWAVHCDNGRLFVTGLAYMMARLLKTRAVRFMTTLGSLCEYPTFLMEYHDGRNPSEVVDRKVGVVWDTRQFFTSEGEPLPFEELDGYKARRIADRMTHERLSRYAKILGFSLEIADALNACYMLIDSLLRKSDATLAEKLESARAVAALCPEAAEATVFITDDQGRIVKHSLRPSGS